MAQPPTHPFILAATADLYRAAIGAQGQDHYLQQFQRFDAQGRTAIGWNGPAFWLTLNWLLYRRMWGWALAYGAVFLGLAGLIFGLGRELFGYSYARAVLLFLALLPLAYLIPGLYGDAWYYRHCQRKIAMALARTDSNAEARQWLTRQAPNRRSLQWLLLAQGLLLALAALWFSGLLDVGGDRLAPTATDTPPSAGAPRVAPAASRALPAPLPATAPTPAPAVAISAPANVASAAAPVEARAPALKPVEPAAAPAAPPVAVARAAQARPASPLLHVWVLQVGAYAQPAHAQRALTQVRALGLEAGVEAYDTPRGRLLRVRVGPFTRRAEAEQAAQRVRARQLPVLLLRQRP